jgi:UDP-N-acetylglucosamine 2-epimerase (non-hydrolysing)
VTRSRGPRLLAVAGARPNFMKVAPIVRAAKRAGWALPWVHTGQHVDAALSDVFLRDLGLPRPSDHLAAGLGTPSRQTARILERLEPVLARRRPDAVLVVGDVTSTLAAALCAANAGIPVAHVEAGLRSFDERMPEERNRVLVDRLSARHYVTEPSGVENLRREGVPAARIRLVGNPMIDALRHALPAIRERTPRATGGVVVTLHRPSNVDEPRRLRAWCAALATVARMSPVTFPVHPRTRARLRALHLEGRLARAGVETTPPLGYLDFASLVAAARVVLTDSGGLQEEASFLGVPCLTLRTTTERPLTLSRGTNRLVGDDPSRLPGEVESVLAAPRPRPYRSRYVDGKASERIVADLRSWLV